MVLRLIIITITSLLLLAACQEEDGEGQNLPEDPEPDEENNNAENEESPVVSETDAEEFTVKLVSEKPVYDTGEEVQITGNLKYTGEGEMMEISYLESPFSFDMVEVNRGVEVPYFLEEEEETTVLDQNEWYEGDFVKRASFRENDEHAEFFKDYMSEPGFPAGEYEIELRVDFAAEEETAENHTYTTSIVIEVRD